jgi:DNA-binding transcriptional regulator LsrR (DeoR family)
MTPKEKELAQRIVAETISQVVPAVVAAMSIGQPQQNQLAANQTEIDEKVAKTLATAVGTAVTKALHANGMGDGSVPIDGYYGEPESFA